MELKKRFGQVWFDVPVIEAALKELQAIWATNKSAEADVDELDNSLIPPTLDFCTVQRQDEHWSFDNLDEWLADYGRRQSVSHAAMHFSQFTHRLFIDVDRYDATVTSSITVQAPQRAQVERVMRVFNNAVEGSRLPDPPVDKKDVVVFLGHGHSRDWREIKDHLQDKQGYRVEAYEVGARAGHGIRDVLGNMLATSSIAFLVMTGEDEQTNGANRARQNVVHEAGLFQGRLGFHRAIAVVEDGTEVFSNLDGVH